MTSANVSSPLIAALVRHYDQLVAHVRRHAARWGGDTTTARDVVHDLCVQLIESPPAAPAHTPLALLRTIATRRAIDRHRAELAHADRVAFSDAPPDPISDTADPARIVAARQRLDVLIRAIDALPERCREVFVLHKIHGLPQQDVATHLGLSIKTVEKHLRLGVAACLAALGGL